MKIKEYKTQTFSERRIERPVIDQNEKKQIVIVKNNETEINRLSFIILEKNKLLDDLVSKHRQEILIWENKITERKASYESQIMINEVNKFTL